MNAQTLIPMALPSILAFCVDLRRDGTSDHGIVHAKSGDHQRDVDPSCGVVVSMVCDRAVDDLG
jgi:hypothetical protein